MRSLCSTAAQLRLYCRAAFEQSCSSNDFLLFYRLFIGKWQCNVNSGKISGMVRTSTAADEGQCLLADEHGRKLS